MVYWHFPCCPEWGLAPFRPIHWQPAFSMNDNELAKVTPDIELGKSLRERVAGTALRSNDDYVFMADLLKHIKGLLGTIEEGLDPAISQAHKAHKSVLAVKKQATENLLEAEKLAKEKLELYYEEHPEEVPKIEGVIMGEVWSGEVIDAALLPREYLVPDLAKLVALAKVLKEETAVQGFRAFRKRVVTVRGG